MRIATSMIFQQSVINTNKRHEEMFNTNLKVSTGKRVNRPSDDPIDAGKILGIRSIVSSIEQYKRNITTGTTWLNYTESSLAQAEQLIIDAKTLAEQMSTGTYNEDQRNMLATQAEQLYDQLVQIGNTQVVDRYIFAGYKTDTQPFSRDNDYNITYSGDNNQFQISIQQRTQVTVNTTGQRAFVNDTNVFDVLRDLRDALRENDQHGVQATLPKLDEALTKVVTERAYVGTSLKQMQTAEMVLDDFGLATEELLSKTEDADMVATITDLQLQQIAYEATLQSTAMVTQLSLVKFV